MFTGIIETIGSVRSVETQGSNITFEIESSISNELKVDQSVSHDGVCLTVVAVDEGVHTVTAIQETLDKSTLGSWKTGTSINLERAMLNNGRFDGHIVQGHVDGRARVSSVSEVEGSWEYTFEMQDLNAALLVEKGSICINGVSLTCFAIASGAFSVAIIPYTYSHTNFSSLAAGDVVNIEYDILGKYVQRLFAARNS